MYWYDCVLYSTSGSLLDWFIVSRRCCRCCCWHRASLFLSLLNAHDASVRPLRRSEKTFTFFLLHQRAASTDTNTHTHTYRVKQTCVHTYYYIVVVLTITVVYTHIATKKKPTFSYISPVRIVSLTCFLLPIFF